MYQIGQFIYKYKENMLPPIFSHMFIVNSDIHQYNTRSSHKFLTARFTTDLGKRAMRHSGIAFWNIISDDIGNSLSLPVFKWRFKLYILEKQI